MDSASGMLVIFFAVFVGVIASSFIIWLFVYRETGVFLSSLIVSVVIRLIQLFLHLYFSYLFPFSQSIWLYLLMQWVLSPSFPFLFTTPPPLSLSLFRHYFNFLYIYIHLLFLNVSYCQALPAWSLRCVLCGRYWSPIQLDGVSGSGYSCKLYVATLATG